MNQATIQTQNIEKIRAAFPILQRKIHNKPFVYLDNGATTQKPEQVIQAIQDYYVTYNSNIHRGVYKTSEEATLAYEAAHAIVAQFIHAQPQEVIFTSGTTESINLLTYSLRYKLQKDDEIILTHMEHHSNIVPWQATAEALGLKIHYAPLTQDSKLDLEQLQAMITDKTKIIAFTHISNVLGTVNPVKEICSLAREKGILTIVDGAQAIARTSLDVKDIGCDFYAFSGHKMYGPTGIGVLYGKQELLEDMPPFKTGGDMIKEVHLEKTTYNDLPWKFEAGTPNIVGGIALGKAIQFIQSIGINNIIQHEQTLLHYALEQLQTVPTLTLHGSLDTNNRAGVISFNLAGIHPHDVATILDREGVALRGGHHCAMPLMKVLGLQSSCRISLGVYNTKQDIDIAVTALKKAVEVFAA